MKNSAVHNILIEELYPRVTTPGEVGIEIEVEGNRLPREIASYWSVHPDGSLRGESAEYVLTKPTSRHNVYRFLVYLQKKLNDAGAEINNSIRTSVHVHINMQGWMIRQIYSFICLYLLFEDILTEYAGPSRVGNLFCLRASDAEYLCTRLISAAHTDSYGLFAEENRLRYASLNVCALAKFNSLEFRAFRGTVSPDQIHQWVNLLLALKDAAQLYPDPRTICQDFSGYGPVNFLQRIFPYPLHLQFALTNAELINRLWEGIRQVQDIAHATNWDVVDTPARPRTFVTDSEPAPMPVLPQRMRAVNPFEGLVLRDRMPDAN